ncbi:MAG: CHAD domain-containing protein [Alphaproteobacteria bacterium]|nr:CHAD domain-containing protein [Alphaproteobacteria bacterium]
MIPSSPIVRTRMALVLKHRRGVVGSVRRSATRCLDRAIDDLKSPDKPPAAVVHEVRKRCNEGRALLRLLRGSLDQRTYRRENAFLRDFRRGFAAYRDQSALAQAYDLLIDRAGSGDHRPSLEARAKLGFPGPNAGEARRLFQAAATELERARRRIAAWRLEDRGFMTIGPGLRRTYRSARRASRRALADPTPEHLHEWRKAAKYHRLHLRLLRPIWKPVVTTHLREVANLTDLLGEDHDLHVLRQRVVQRRAELGADSRLILNLLDRRRAALLSEIVQLGQRVFAERPGALARRFRAYFTIWQRRHEPTVLRLTEAPRLATPIRRRGT